MSRWHAFRGILRRNLVTMRRYMFNTLSSMATLYIVFLMLFFGARAVAGADFALSGTQDGLIVGYFIWSLAIFAYSELAWGLSNEAQQGTLEQLYLSPFGFRFVNACNVVSNLSITLLLNLLLLLAAMATVGRWLTIDLVSLLPVLVLTLVGVVGFGFAIGGLALVFKRIQAFFQVVQFVMVAFIAAPWSTIPWARYLPLAMGNHLARQIMSDGVRLWQLDRGDLVVLLVTSLAYLGLGLAAFGLAEGAARERGLLGQY